MSRLLDFLQAVAVAVAPTVIGHALQRAPEPCPKCAPGNTPQEPETFAAYVADRKRSR